MDIIKKINVKADSEVEKRAQGAMEMEVKTKQGAIHHRRIDIPYGFPGKEMTREEHLSIFRQCTSYGKNPLSKDKADKIIFMIDKMEYLEDVRDFIPLMTGK